MAKHWSSVQPDLFEAFNSLPPAMNKTIPAIEVLFPPDPTLPPGFPMSACLFIDPITCEDSPVPFNIPLNFAFWDVVHPTTEAHWYLAEYLKSSLTTYYKH